MSLMVCSVLLQMNNKIVRKLKRASSNGHIKQFMANIYYGSNKFCVLTLKHSLQRDIHWEIPQVLHLNATKSAVQTKPHRAVLSYWRTKILIEKNGNIGLSTLFLIVCQRNIIQYNENRLTILWEIFVGCSSTDKPATPVYCILIVDIFFRI